MEQRLRDQDEKLELLNKKVDRLLLAVEGDGEAIPGMAVRMSVLERVIFGKEGDSQGLVTRVTIMWRIHFWLACSLSAGLGFLVREGVKLIWHV